MIAVIAGTGSLPTEACKKLVQEGKAFFVICLFPEENQQQLQTVIGQGIELVAEKCFKAGAILRQLQERKTTQVLFIGKVDKNNLLKQLKLDWLALKIMGSLVTRGDKDVMEALLKELASNGMSTIRQDEVLDGLLVKPGILCGELTKTLEASIQLGIKTALTISKADIGQTVVVKNAMVLAVEAIEGTDACIQRGLALGKEGVVICKAAHQEQNKSYDLPTLGPKSLASFKPGDVAAIAWVASHTLIAEKEQFIARAKELEIVLVAI
ncbi:LpxI family protein [Candidatus Dependentiae bacterium]|nr:LpxI family protein [Candidatus Dependentiae bacterium]